MSGEPAFAALGRETDRIPVRLSHRIITLFSEGLYTSPNKAIEELVANSFDAGAETVHVVTSLDGGGDGDTIAVFDDGEGMDGSGLKSHWLIGRTNKRSLPSAPRGRLQIGKFGIGKLATYVLANRLTHISRQGKKYYSASMNFREIGSDADGEGGGERKIEIPLRKLTGSEARKAVGMWAGSGQLRKSGMGLFGKGSPRSWTVSIMSDLKPMAGEISIGRLGWILRTALPLRSDFKVWLNGNEIRPSKADRSPVVRRIIGKDLADLGPVKIAAKKSTDASLPRSSEHRFGLDVEGLGRITGYAEAYDAPLGGKSDVWGRSSGFFVYARGRLVNAADGHFGILPNELRHGTFSRFRAVVHIDKLDDDLRSSREAIGDGATLHTAQDVLRAIFNAVRNDLYEYDRDGEQDTKLARRVTAGPASVSRRPIASLARAVSEGRARSRHLAVPTHRSADRREEFLADLERSVMEPESFMAGRRLDVGGDPNDVIAKFDTASRRLVVNMEHPFASVFEDTFKSKKHGQPLDLLVMSEIAGEAQMYQSGLDPKKIDAAVMARDRVLRHLVHESGRQSPSFVARALEDTHHPADFERRVCDAFRSLGFDVRRLGGSGGPDGLAEASLAASDSGDARRYTVSIEAKSKEKKGGAVPASRVDISAVARHCRDHKCDHAVVVGPAFQGGGGGQSALDKSIRDACARREVDGAKPISITAISTHDLARLVRLRPVKWVGLAEIRELFRTCKLPGDCTTWVDEIAKKAVENPPYRKIIEAIASHQKEFRMAPVLYPALRVALSKMAPPIKYETDGELAELCKAMAQMSRGAIWADSGKVDLDQSQENAIGAIEAALQEHEPEQGGAGSGGKSGRAG